MYWINNINQLVTRLIDAREDERQELDACLTDMIGNRKSVVRQLIDSAVFDGEKLEVIPNMATLTGTGVKVASPRGFEPLLPP